MELKLTNASCEEFAAEDTAEGLDRQEEGAL